MVEEKLHAIFNSAHFKNKFNLEALLNASNSTSTAKEIECYDQ